MSDKKTDSATFLAYSNNIAFLTQHLITVDFDFILKLFVSID